MPAFPAATVTLRLLVQGEVEVPGQVPVPLTPQVLGSTHLRRLLLEVERLVQPQRRTGPGALVFGGLSGALERAAGKGGVTLTFRLAEATAADLRADLVHLAAGQSLDRLRTARARQLSLWQQRAHQPLRPSLRKQDRPIGVRYELRLDGLPDPLVIDAETQLGFREQFADAEVYLYGTITRMGGKAQPRIQIRDELHGTLMVGCRRSALESESQNRLYRAGGLQARGRLQAQTGRLDRLELVSFVTLADVWPPNTEPPAHIATLLQAPGGSGFPHVPPDWLAQRRGAVGHGWNAAMGAWGPNEAASE